MSEHFVPSGFLVHLVGIIAPEACQESFYFYLIRRDFFQGKMVKKLAKQLSYCERLDLKLSVLKSFLMPYFGAFLRHGCKIFSLINFSCSLYGLVFFLEMFCPRNSVFRLLYRDILEVLSYKPKSHTVSQVTMNVYHWLTEPNFKPLDLKNMAPSQLKQNHQALGFVTCN